MVLVLVLVLVLVWHLGWDFVFFGFGFGFGLASRLGFWLFWFWFWFLWLLGFLDVVDFFALAFPCKFRNSDLLGFGRSPVSGTALSSCGEFGSQGLALVTQVVLLPRKGLCVCVCVCVEPEPYIAPVVEVLVIFASTNHVICVVGFVLLLLLLLLATEVEIQPRVKKIRIRLMLVMLCMRSH